MILIKFFSIYFLSIAEYDNVRQCLLRFEKDGVIKKVIKGFYYKLYIVNY